MTKPRSIGHIFWIVQFVDVCIAAPRILATVGSCPCRSTSECPDRSEFRYNGSQVSILPCENEDFVRCCPTVPTAIEFANTSGNVQDQRNKLEDEVGYGETLSASDSMQVEETLDESSTSTLQPDGSSTDVPTLSMNAQSSEDHSGLTMNATEKEDVDRAASIGNYEDMSENIENSTIFANANPKLTLQQPRVTKTASILEPRPSHVRISNRTSTLRYHPEEQSTRRKGSTTRKTDRFVRPEVAQFAQDNQEPSYQALISQATRFHSHRTSPKQPVSFQVRDSREQNKKNLVEIMKPLVPGRAISSRGRHPNASYKFPSTAKSSSEKISDLTERKTSLAPALTLDKVSTRAINENASSVSKLNASQRDDASFRNLSHPEDIEDVKRVARSHASDFEGTTKEPDNSPNSSSVSNANAKNENETEPGQARRFKRPPRILPTRHLRNENRLNKFLNSRERARSLFDKSNETRRNQVSAIINRSDSSLRRSMANYIFAGMEEIIKTPVSIEM